MVDCQIRTADVTDTRIIEAMLSVPREKFVPVGQQDIAYLGEDLCVSGAGGPAPRHLIEPPCLAKLVQLAEIGQDDVVLDIGCATGYSSAVLAKLASSVVALEADETLAAAATSTLLEIDADNVAVVTGPLADGYPSQSPYDVIFLNGSVPEVPEALFGQLSDHGRLVAVVQDGPCGKGQLFTCCEGRISSRSVFDAWIAPLPGFAVEKAFAL